MVFQGYEIIERQWIYPVSHRKNSILYAKWANCYKNFILLTHRTIQSIFSIYILLQELKQSTGTLNLTHVNFTWKQPETFINIDLKYRSVLYFKTEKSTVWLVWPTLTLRIVTIITTHDHNACWDVCKNLEYTKLPDT